MFFKRFVAVNDKIARDREDIGGEFYGFFEAPHMGTVLC
jgi:hypothetical protein